ncbi:isochorismatase domain-containing protein 2-like isoform X3 [Mytilus californianus]|uniref:isochorismatase domain-containing protein 2-like isoform X3 n=1 Tax=Mytilus californianus TaxID=6549 RepID=UPI0022482C42|nr:isochorismatase domain-containing protein 2-like isoform X3 [Mytilus californianus]
MARRLGKINLKNTALFLCDMQEKFRGNIVYYPQIISVANRMLQGAKVLEMPVVVTEQYPKGLGPTVSEIDVSQEKVFPKTSFSMFVPTVVDHMKTLPDVKSKVLCGIENHVCIQNTVLDLLEENFDIHIIADACSSRSMTDRMFAFQRMSEAGAYITTSECMMLGLCGVQLIQNLDQYKN